MRNAADKEQKGDFAQPYCLLSITTAARLVCRASSNFLSCHLHLSPFTPLFLCPPSHENSNRVTLDLPPPLPRASKPFRCVAEETSGEAKRRCDNFADWILLFPSEQASRLRFDAIYLNSDEFRAPIDEERRLGDRSVPNKTYRRMLDEEPLFPKKQRPFSINRDAFTNVDVDRSLYGIGEIRTWKDSLSRVSKRS